MLPCKAKEKTNYFFKDQKLGNSNCNWFTFADFTQLYGENMLNKLRNYYNSGKLNFSYKHVNKLNEYHKNCDTFTTIRNEKFGDGEYYKGGNILRKKALSISKINK